MHLKSERHQYRIHTILKRCSILFQKNMLYQGIVVLLILLLISQVTEESGYNCTDSDGYQHNGNPLVECPPAKFMIEDGLVECFDNFTIITNILGKYWFNT